MKKLIHSIFFVFLFIFIFLQNNSINSLSQNCIETLQPYLNKLGMSYTDLNEPEKMKKFRDYYRNKSEWGEMRNACHPHPLQACDCANNCGCKAETCYGEKVWTHCTWWKCIGDSCCSWDCCDVCKH